MSTYIPTASSVHSRHTKPPLLIPFLQTPHLSLHAPLSLPPCAHPATASSLYLDKRLAVDLNDHCYTVFMRDLQVGLLSLLA